jgi:hypothetical protein
MENKKSMITINWRGKENKRGLVETAMETMRKVSVKCDRPTLMEDADKLEGEYMKCYQIIEVKGLKQLSVFPFEKELAMVKQYVRVRL